MKSDITFIGYKNRSNRKAGSGHQNIKIIKSGYQVLINSMSYGIFPTMEEALAKRDVVREKHGLPKAEY